MSFLRVSYRFFLLFISCFIFIFITFPFTIFVVLPMFFLYILPFDYYKREPYYSVGSRFVRSFIQLSFFWRVTVKDLDNFKELKDPCVYISNHQSYFDIFVLYFIRRRFKWVSKKELNYIPYFGMYLYLMKNISISRANPKSIKKAMDTCSFFINKQKYSVFIFPEGTRVKPGQEPLRFKKGAFKLAVENKVPIAPIVIKNIYGSDNLKTLLTQKKKINIEINVLKPVHYDDRFKNINEYMEYIKGEMKQKLES